MSTEERAFAERQRAGADPRLDDTVLDHLADRLAEGLFRRGMVDRPAEDGAIHHRAKLDMMGGSALNRRHEEFDMPPETRGPLLEIAERINSQRKRITNIAGNLNLHADRVSGVMPVDPRNDRMTDGAEKGMPAIQEIFIALERLDIAIAEADGAASRNTNLA